MRFPDRMGPERIFIRDFHFHFPDGHSYTPKILSNAPCWFLTVSAL